jgi:molybdate transport system substrate-binding protein
MKVLALAGVLSLLSITAGQAAEINIISAAIMRPVFGELGPEFERATGHKLVAKYGVTGEMKRQIEGGEAFDLVIAGSALVDDLIKQGKIAADSRTPLARAGMGVAVRAGSVKPNISSVDAFKSALLNAKSISYVPEGATGVQLAKIIEKLGISEQMKAKSKPQTNPANVGKAVAAGEAELGLALAPILVAAPGAELAGLFPDELQDWFVNTAGVSAAAKQPDAAKALIKHLTTPAASAVIKAKGLEPVNK